MSSNFINAQWPTLRTTSNWINTQAVALGGSESANGQVGLYLRATSNRTNALAGNAIPNAEWQRYIVGTSNWVAAHAASIIPVVNGAVTAQSLVGQFVRIKQQSVSQRENFFRENDDCGHAICVDKRFIKEARQLTLDINKILTKAGIAEVGFKDGSVFDVIDNYVPLIGNWTCNGTVKIRGFGNILDLIDKCIIVKKHSTIIFEDIAIVGLEKGSIVLEEDANILFQNTSFGLCSDKAACVVIDLCIKNKMKILCQKDLDEFIENLLWPHVESDEHLFLEAI
ncbi:hypothetical protein FJ364_05865 [Candidatus Dependentiae bacterium]|nr:hypothetical protein [Candidatus Dependentiae bacterium]